MNLGTARHWLRRVHIDVCTLSDRPAVSQPAMVFTHTSLNLSSITFTMWDLSAMRIFKYVDITSEIPAIEMLRLNKVLEILERDRLELKKYGPQLVFIRLSASIAEKFHGSRIPGLKKLTSSKQSSASMVETQI